MEKIALLNFDRFVLAARCVHAERFQYDRSSWVSPSKNIRIRCSKHGWFYQVGYTHLSSTGCSQCGREERVARQLIESFKLFMKRAKKIHGDRFYYDKSSWQGTNKKMFIHCNEHGWFDQIPYDHLKFGGCHPCERNAMKLRLSNKGWNRFLIDYKRVHGNRFEYDRDSWKGVKEKVKIKCSEHGWFEQVASDHLRMDGCRFCSAIERGASIRLSEDDLIKRFKKVHGKRYGYDSIEYAGIDRKVKIKCNEHGFFMQTASQHIRGDGCQKCSGRHRWSTQEFIKNSKEIHGSKFTYEKTRYTRALDSVIITCKVHGDFTTQPSRHIIKKHGCKKCSPSAPRTLGFFLKAAKKRFGDRYDYSLVDFVDMKKPVKIICETHGVFEQPPGWHLKNSIGCQQCSYNVSGKETAWLDSLDLPQTAKRQAKVKLGGRLRNVDAYDPASKTIWEFWGDWWHGHPDFFDPQDIHPMTRTSYGKLYQDTQKKRALIKKEGFALVEIWEHEYNDLVDQGVMKRPEGRMSKKKPRKRKQLCASSNRATISL